MAVNDLMMRIQLLVDSGKSSAELGRLSGSLSALRKQLDSLEKNRLTPLTRDLEGVKQAAASLRSVNLQNFATQIDAIKKSFSGLGIATQNLDKLKTAYEALNKQTNSNDLQKYQNNLKAVNDRLKEAKKLTLTGSGQSFNTDYGQSLRDLARYNSAILTASKSIVEQRREVLRLKNDLANTSKIKFDSGILVELNKLNARRGLNGQSFSVIDKTAIGDLQAYNQKLTENQQKLLAAQVKSEGYRQTLAKLRLEAQKLAIPDLTIGGTRNLVSELEQAKKKISDLQSNGILPLQNSIRDLQAKASFNKAFNIDPIKANVKVLRAEIAKLQLDASNALNTGNQQKHNTILGEISDKYKKIVGFNLDIAQAEQRAQQTTARGIAHINQRLAAKKNELAIDKQQEQAIKALIAQQKQSSQLAAQAVKTRSGGIFDTVAASNNTKSEANIYKQNLQALKQYLSERKAAAQVDIDAAKQQVYNAQLALAQGQLTKAQYVAERAEIKANITAEKERSRAYQQTLVEQQKGIRDSITSEKERTKGLLSEIRNLRQLATAEADLQKVQLQRQLVQSRNTQSSLRDQIKETESLSKAELNRLAALEKIAQQSNSLSSIFRRINGSASVEPAIQATQNLITNVTSQLKKLGDDSVIAKNKLAAIGGTSDLPKVSQEIKQTVADLKSLKQSGFTGTQTYSDLERQLGSLREQRALLRQIASIDTKTQAGQIELKGLNENLRGLRSYAAEMGRVQRFMSGFGFNLTAEMLGQSAFQTVTNALQRMGRAFIEANSKAETLIRGLDAVFGKGKGEIQYEKLTALANKYGLGLQDLSRNYLQLNASAKGTVLEGQESEKIFTSLSAAMAVLGADTISTQRAFRAVSQMISKGQVYAEELKGQLAESLPGAVQLFARSMGKTAQEFLAMVKAGQVGLNELIPFFKLIEQEYGNAATASTTYEQATNRLGNAWTLLLKGIGDLGVWKAVVAAIDETSGAVQFLADKLKNNPFEELYNLQNLKVDIISEEQFNKLREIQGKKVTPTGLFDANDYAAYKKANEETNKLLDERIAKLKESKIEFDVQQTRESIDAISKELKDVLTREQYEVKLKASIPDITSSELDSAYEKYLKDFDKKIIDLTKLREQLSKLLASQSQTQTHDNQTKINKQYIKSITDELKIQQQAYSNLNAVQGKLASSELKRLQAINGIGKETNSKYVVEEVKNTISLVNAQSALNRAREIESAIVTGSKEESKNTRQEEATALRNLTLEQLRHSMTLARSANNQNLILAIMKEQTRVMRDIRMTDASFNTNVFSGLSGVTGEVKTKIQDIQKELKASATATSSVVSEMSKVLSLMEQRKRLTNLLSDNKANQQSFEQQVAWEKELFNIESKRMSEKQKARKTLAVAEKAYSAAQEQLNIVQTSTNFEDIDRASKSYKQLIQFVDSLTGKTTQAGKASEKFAERVSNLKVEATQAEFRFNDYTLNAEIKRIDDLISKSVGKDGKFDIEVGVKTATDNLTKLQNTYIDLKKQLETASGEDNTAIERQIKQILPEISLAEQELIQLGQQFQALNIGKPIEFTIDPSIKNDLEDLKGTLDGILLNKPLTFGTDIPVEPAKAQVESARAAMQAKADEQSVVINITTNRLDGGADKTKVPTVDIETAFIDPTNDVNKFSKEVNYEVEQGVKPVSLKFNPPKNVDPFLTKVSNSTRAVFTSLEESQNDWGLSVGDTVLSASRLIDYFADKSRVVISSTFDQMAISVQISFRKVMTSILEVYAGITNGIADTFEGIATLLENAGAVDTDNQLRQTVQELRSHKQAYKENEEAIRSLNEEQRKGAAQTQQDLNTIEQKYRSMNQTGIQPMSSIVNNSNLQQQLALLGQFADLVDIQLRAIGQDQTEITITPKIDTNTAKQQYQGVVTTLEQGGFIKTALSVDVEESRRSAVAAQQAAQVAVPPLELKVKTDALQSKIETIKSQIQSLQSQQPQGIVAGRFSEEVNQREQAIAKLRLELVNLQNQLSSVNTTAQTPIAPKVDTTSVDQAKTAITTIRQDISDSKIGEPIVIKAETQQAITNIQKLIKERDNYRQSAMESPNFDPSTYYNTLEAMNQKIRTALSDDQVAIAQFIKNYSMDFVRGNEVIVNSFKVISSRGIDALRQDYQNLKLDNVNIKVDEQGFQRQVKRLQITGQNALDKPFVMQNFQVKATTWDEIVSEGNRFMQNEQLILQGKLDPATINDVSNKVQIKPTFENPQLAYQEMQAKIRAENPITVAINAQGMIGEIQSQLAALKASGATNIQVTVDQSTGKLIVTADTSQATSEVNAIISQIESKTAVLKVDVKYNDPGRSGGNIGGYAHGGQIPGGYSMKDSFLAMLAPGEFVIPSNIVKQYGPGYFNSLIKGQKQPSMKDNIHVPHFASGGLAGSATTVNFNFGSAGKFSLSGSRDQVKGVTKALSQIARTL